MFGAGTPSFSKVSGSGGGSPGTPPGTGGSGGGGGVPIPLPGGSGGGGGGNHNVKTRVNQNIEYEDRLQGIHYWYQGFLQDVPEGGPLPNALPKEYFFLLEKDYSWQEVVEPLKKTGRPFAEWGWGFNVSVDIPNPGKRTDNIFLYFPGRISPIDMVKNHIGFIYLEGGSEFGFSVSLKHAKKLAMQRGGRRAVLVAGDTRRINSASSFGLWSTVAVADDGTVATGGLGPAFAYTEEKGETIATLVVLKGEPEQKHQDIIDNELGILEEAFWNKINSKKAAYNIGELDDKRLGQEIEVTNEPNDKAVHNIEELFGGREIILQRDRLKEE
jgi:hypothetical protein